MKIIKGLVATTILFSPIISMPLEGNNIKNENDLLPREEQAQQAEPHEGPLAVEENSSLVNIPRAVVSDVEKTMEHIFVQLKSCVVDLDFLAEKFDQIQTQVGEELFSSNHWARKVIPHNHDLLQKLNFIEQVFEAMILAKELLSYFNFSSIDCSILRHIVNLNIKLFTLYKISGHPNSQMPGFAKKVTELGLALTYWDNIFRYSETVPTMVSSMFESQLEIARARLKDLAKEIPLKEYHRLMTKI